MDGFDATELAERLNGEQQDYWVHVEAESPLEKYPGQSSIILSKFGTTS
jgi:Xaa-Pro dipeptidase